MEGPARRETSHHRGASTDSFFPDYENESQEAGEEETGGVNYRKGDRVRHIAWGEGTITLVQGSGEDTRISVAFSQGFSKKIMVRYASLEHFPRKGSHGHRS